MKKQESPKQSNSNRTFSEDVHHQPNSPQQSLIDQSPEALEAQKLQQLADNSSETTALLEWQKKINTTGLPDDLKAAIESASGLSLDAVRVHYNSDKPAQIGAYAYADYPNIYVAPGQEKHLPEEAWHIVQQMQGKTKATEKVNNTAIDGNNSREKEAKTKGNKALKTTPKTPQKLQTKKAKGGVVQRSKVEKKSHYGTFSVESSDYKFIESNKRLNLDLTFEPTANADATKVGLVQTIKKRKSGNHDPIDPNLASKTTTDGANIDQLSGNRNPLYATGSTEPNTDKDKLEAYSTPDGQHALKGNSGWTQNANIKDKPTIQGNKNSKKEFETSAIALEGNDKGEYYGSVKWGWEKDGSGTLKKIAFDLVSKGVPSKNFMEAAEKWNSTKTRGTLVVKNNNTKAYSLGLEELFTLSKDDELSQQKTMGSNAKSYVWAKVTKATKASNKDKEGLFEVDQLKDKGDGKNTVKLPIVKTLVPTENDIPLYKDKGKVTEDKKLPTGTRMKKIGEDNTMVQVEIVDGPDITKKGWVEKTKLKNE